METRYNIDNILELLKGQDVYVFGSSPEISDLFLTPYGIEVMSDTNVTLDPHPEQRNFKDLKIDINKHKKKLINDIFLDELGFRNKITLGLNLFSAFYDTTIALWADKTPFISKNILLNSGSEYLVTSMPTIQNLDPDFEQHINKITNYLTWQGTIEPCNNGNYHKTYQGYIYWWRSILVGVLHLCCMAKAKNVYIIGAGCSPKSIDYFYAKIDKDVEWSFLNPEVVEILRSFQESFPSTKIYQTSTTSELPFEVLTLEEIKNGKETKKNKSKSTKNQSTTS